MTYGRVVLVLIAAWCGVGCDGCFSFDFGGLDGLGCLFNFDYETTIDSDNGVLRAIVECEPNADCADSRDVIVGSRFEYIIEVPEHLAGDEQNVIGSRGVELSGYDTHNDVCDRTIQLIGEAKFTETGTSSVTVQGDGRVLDSFTVSVWEPATLDVQAAKGVFVFGNVLEDGGISTPVYSSYPPGTTLSIDSEHSLRAFVRNQRGDRLVGATGFSWHVTNPAIATVSGDRHATLRPLANGRTTLLASGGGLSVEISLEVTGAPFSYDDGTTDGDAGADDEDASAP